MGWRKPAGGLCAWCSIPEDANSRKEWQYHTGFADLHGEFPKLVDREGVGGARHFHSATDFAWEHPNLMRKSYAAAKDLGKKFDRLSPEKVPPQVLRTLVAYYAANRPEDGDWVVLPVINFDCYFGDTNFGRKYLTMLPDEIIQRNSSFGVSRYRVREEYLPK